MKSIYITIAVLLLFTKNIVSQDIHNLDEKGGFKMLLFGMPEDSIKSIASLSLEKTRTRYYIVSDPKLLKVGESIQIDKISLAFYKGKLLSITIKTKGFVNSTGMLNVLNKAYGFGKKPNEYIEEYYWWGNKVSMSYNQNSITDDASIFMFSKELSEEREQEMEKEKTKAVGDL
jgi:hypothetical protein